MSEEEIIDYIKLLDKTIKDTKEEKSELKEKPFKRILLYLVRPDYNCFEEMLNLYQEQKLEIAQLGNRIIELENKLPKELL